MAIKGNTINAVGYGLTNALQSLAPQPILANRAPNVSDSKPIGSLWCWPATQEVWVNDGVVAGLSQWILISQGGAGVFTSLLVNPGPVTTQGTGAVSISGDAVNTTVGLGNGAGAKLVSVGSATGASSLTLRAGTGNFSLDGVAGTTYTVGASTTTGTITIGGTAQTGTLTFGGGTGAQIVNLATGATGVKTVHIADSAVANVVTLGSLTGAASLKLQSGTGGLSLATGATTAGLVSVAPLAGTVAAGGSDTLTANSRVVVGTFTGYTTASGDPQGFKIASSLITTSSAILVTVTNLNASGNNALMTIEGVVQSTGQIAVACTNNGAGALGAGDNVLVNVWILS